MKLSEAIREGSKNNKQLFGVYSITNYGECKGTCALGAAIRAISPNGSPNILREHFGLITAQVVQHPLHYKTDRVDAIIIDLNDRWKWSREKIADWVETIEVENNADKS